MKIIEITTFIIIMVIISIGCIQMKKIDMSALNHNSFPNLDVPLVLEHKDSERYKDQIVYVVGIDQQQDVRMRQESPSKLFEGINFYFKVVG